MSVSCGHGGTYKISEQNCLADVLTAIETLPVLPYILNGEIAAVADLLHPLNDPTVVDRVLREACLYLSFRPTAAMKVPCMCEQRLDLRVRYPQVGEVRVVQRQLQSGRQFNEVCQLLRRIDIGSGVP